MGKLLENMAQYERDVEACRKNYGIEDEKTLSAMGKLARRYDDLEKYAEALKVYEDVLAVVSKRKLAPILLI